MLSSRLGFATARIFSVMSLIFAFVALLAQVACVLNALEISSIFNRWLGSSVWVPAVIVLGCGPLALIASKATTWLLMQAAIVADQERAMRS